MPQYLSPTRIENYNYWLVIASIILQFHETKLPFLFPAKIEAMFPIEEQIMTISHEEFERFNLIRNIKIDSNPYEQDLVNEHVFNRYDIHNKICYFMTNRNEWLL